MMELEEGDAWKGRILLIVVFVPNSSDGYGDMDVRMNEQVTQ
jgi:hypothetical protein